ncbi:hypothetical protein [Sphingosinicella rhizophila]|uniref:Restriction endonuclease type IV Mrr domain-containing protein n=1 Tax=Sphingosinicella rhizophila TaxID=3050082 RepID=A0ABU3QBA8_9SPHN|nr:hypothetical protein [Sphingosinicella sp. GR2756]MDT9600439.1 hypothetical protein [Sphingosinicella sp. GR2756]
MSLHSPPESTGADADARRLALEAIATLVYIKKTAADQVLRRAGVPEDLIRRFLTERDPATGEKRSKRDAGALMLEELAATGADHAVIRNIVGIAADWSAFHLAQNEYQARAVVQKAREVRGVLAEADARERAEADARSEAAARQHRREQRETLARQSALLLAQFDQAASSPDHQQRGYLLEDLLNRTFDLHGIPVLRAFRRNGGAEQIDAAFELDGWHYLVECRWRARLADIRQLDGLAGQVARSGRQTMGLFLSIEGWSENVVPLLKQNPAKAILLMEGFDLRSVLDQRVDLRELLKAKISALNLEAEPYLSVAKLLT